MTTKNGILETWGGRHIQPPLGACVRHVVRNGKAAVCGKPADRQVCDECREAQKKKERSRR